MAVRSEQAIARVAIGFESQIDRDRLNKIIPIESAIARRAELRGI
jgi:hypothetical protein